MLHSFFHDTLYHRVLPVFFIILFITDLLVLFRIFGPPLIPPPLILTFSFAVFFVLIIVKSLTGDNKESRAIVVDLLWDFSF